MTIRYVRSGASGANNGTSKTDAYTTYRAALVASSAGDVIYVASDHAETQASSMSLASVGTATSPIKAICVDFTGSTPPVSADLRTTASITTTGSNAISFSGAGTFTIHDGIIFNCGTGSVNWAFDNSARVSLKFRNCALRFLTTAGNNMTMAGSGGKVDLENTTMQFNNTGQYVEIDGEVVWRGGSITGSTFPTTLFSPALSGIGGNLVVDGVDLSSITGTLVGSATSQALVARLMDCKINGSATIAATPNQRGRIQYLRLDSGGTNYKHGLITYAGSQVQETTIVLTGGASDGTTPVSWKIVTTANSTEFFPFESLPIAIWNDTTGSSVTATVQGIWGGGSVPNNDDIWGEVEYLGSSSSPLASFVNNGRADILAANSALSAGSGTWGGSTTKFKLNVTFTPQQKGWILFRVKAAKASSTFYIDPKVVLT